MRVPGKERLTQVSVKEGVRLSMGRCSVEKDKYAFEQRKEGAWGMGKRRWGETRRAREGKE